MNENKLYLSAFRDEDTNPKFLNYCLQTHNCDNFKDYQDVFQIAREVMIDVFSEMTVMSSFNYKLIKRPKNLLNRNKERAMFEKHQFADSLVENIDSKKYDYYYLFKEYQANNGRNDYRKKLYVYSKKFSSEFLENVSEKTEYEKNDIHYDFNIVGYLQNSGIFAKKSNAFMELDDIVEDYLTENNSVICFSGVSYHSLVYISINPYRYPIERLIEKLKPIVEKYGKRLEVNI
ncbi:MAG: hypothetical protein RSA27_07765 [Oscillospiraceae bacterium]